MRKEGKIKDCAYGIIAFLSLMVAFCLFPASCYANTETTLVNLYYGDKYVSVEDIDIEGPMSATVIVGKDTYTKTLQNIDNYRYEDDEEDYPESEIRIPISKVYKIGTPVRVSLSYYDYYNEKVIVNGSTTVEKPDTDFYYWFFTKNAKKAKVQVYNTHSGDVIKIKIGKKVYKKKA